MEFSKIQLEAGIKVLKELQEKAIAGNQIKSKK
jgi:hypothetical protein